MFVSIIQVVVLTIGWYHWTRESCATRWDPDAWQGAGTHSAIQTGCASQWHVNRQIPSVMVGYDSQPLARDSCRVSIGAFVWRVNASMSHNQSVSIFCGRHFQLFWLKLRLNPRYPLNRQRSPVKQLDHNWISCEFEACNGWSLKRPNTNPSVFKNSTLEMVGTLEFHLVRWKSFVSAMASTLEIPVPWSKIDIIIINSHHCNQTIQYTWRLPSYRWSWSGCRICCEEVPHEQRWCTTVARRCGDMFDVRIAWQLESPCESVKKLSR